MIRTVEADIHQGQRNPSITGRIYGCNELFSKSLSNVLQTGWVHICSLGRYPDLKLADTRKLIPELRNSVANNIDPRVFWKQCNTFVDQTTLRDCSEQFLSARSAALKPGTVATYQSCFRAHLYDAFADRKVESITLGEWIDFFDKKAIHSRVTAGAILKQLKTVLSWSVRRQMISLVDVLQLRVSDVGSAPKVGSRVLTILECGKIIRELDKCRAPKAVTNAIKACLLTGAYIRNIKIQTG